MAMKENTRKVYTYLKEHDGNDHTAADVAEALGLEKRQVDGIFTSAIQRKGYGFREESEATMPDGNSHKVKFLRLTDEGRAFDLDAHD